MGLYTEETYKEYGPHWKENLFFSHLLGLPLFIPFLPSIIRQFLKLAGSPPLSLPTTSSSDPSSSAISPSSFSSISNLPSNVRAGIDSIYIPSQLAFLVINVLTQYTCIRGVNLLAAASSALTVTIVLNVRKLVSLLLSIWLFGNKLSPGTMIGAVIVFFAGGIYGLKGEKASSNRSRYTANVSNRKIG